MGRFSVIVFLGLLKAEKEDEVCSDAEERTFQQTNTHEMKNYDYM